MKTAKEKAEEWGCSKSTVKNYCASGIIPPAEKTGPRGGWMIPDEWGKPPMSRHGLCYLLDTIVQLNSGVQYGEIQFGYSDETIKSGYGYLISHAFMSSIDINHLDRELGNATVTPRGTALIERENNERKDGTKFKVHGGLAANAGIVSAEFGGVVTND